nr:uncharacterized protein LOC129523705 [Gorilla gorilla gorilla]
MESGFEEQGTALVGEAQAAQEPTVPSGGGAVRRREVTPRQGRKECSGCHGARSCGFLRMSAAGRARAPGRVCEATRPLWGAPLWSSGGGGGGVGREGRRAEGRGPRPGRDPAKGLGWASRARCGGEAGATKALSGRAAPSRHFAKFRGPAPRVCCARATARETALPSPGPEAAAEAVSVHPSAAWRSGGRRPVPVNPSPGGRRFPSSPLTSGARVPRKLATVTRHSRGRRKCVKPFCRALGAGPARVSGRWAASEAAVPASRWLCSRWNGTRDPRLWATCNQPWSVRGVRVTEISDKSARAL